MQWKWPFPGIKTYAKSNRDLTLALIQQAITAQEQHLEPLPSPAWFCAGVVLLYRATHFLPTSSSWFQQSLVSRRQDTISKHRSHNSLPEQLHSHLASQVTPISKLGFYSRETQSRWEAGGEDDVLHLLYLCFFLSLSLIKRGNWREKGNFTHSKSWFHNRGLKVLRTYFREFLWWP